MSLVYVIQAVGIGGEVTDQSERPAPRNPFTDASRIGLTAPVGAGLTLSVGAVLAVALQPRVVKSCASGAPMLTQPAGTVTHRNRLWLPVLVDDFAVVVGPDRPTRSGLSLRVVDGSRVMIWA